uniref:Fe2OG dioxygenase domain-containing protein n=1 Tax=Mesocestoides corti TaxID=53468 RepID=A0A5K3FRG9_MESCO
MCSVRTIQKSGAPLCACRGIRVCSLCEQEKHTSGLLKNSSEFVQLAFCSQCSKAFSDESPGKPACPDHSDGFKFFGITILDEFLSEEEEADLIRKIDASPWVPSQSGRSKQDYGAKVNFKKRRISTKYFTGLPDYSRSLVERLHHRMRNNGARFKDFYPVELCNLEYLPERGAAIVPHLDDTWLWGERLVLLNLASPTRMTFTLPANGPGVPGEWERYKTFAASYLPPSQAGLPPSVAVSLPRRSLLIIADKARFTWLHAINRNEVLMRRLSLTMRELSNEFL